jgi:hypothetical protein
MDSVLSSLGTLISNIKSLTLPGLVAALGFAILLWPPQPIDVVTDVILNPRYAIWPTTKSGLTALANTERRVKSDSRLKSEKDHPGLKPWGNNDFGPVCWTRPGTATAPPPSTQGQPAARQSNASGQTARPDTSGGASDANTSQAQPETVSKEGRERVLRQPQSLPENKPVAVANQFDLERIQRQLQDCADKESALSGAEQSLITDITAEVSVLTNERDAIRDTYLGYEKSANPLRDLFLEKLRKKEDEIRDKQTEIHEAEQLQRERVRRGAELTHLASDITLRLGEPGRLRPLQKFDDFLASLGSHVIAFLTLAIAWSLLFEPINRAVFGWVYDRGFDDQLDYVWWDSNSRDTHISLTNRARLDEWTQARQFYAHSRPDIPGSEPELKDHKPPTILSICLALAASAAAVVVLAVLLFVYGPLSNQPSDAPRLCIGLVGECAGVLGSAPDLGVLFAGCMFATAAGLCLALAITWGWSWKKSNGRQKAQKAMNDRDNAAEEAIKTEQEKKRLDAEQLEQRRKQIQQELKATGLTVDERKKKEEELTKIEEAQKKEEDKQKAALKCPQDLAAQWLKIRQPEFAIGQGLITRDAYNAIRNEYYAQSTISIGIILPLMLLTFAMLATPQIGVTPSALLWFVFITAQMFLLLVGADRKHKFDMEVETTIVSTFLKNCEAAKKPADDSTPKPPTLIELIQAELKKAKIVEKTDFKLELGDDPAKKR